MSFTEIGGIPSATIEDGEKDSEGVSAVLLSTRREGKEQVDCKSNRTLNILDINWSDLTRYSATEAKHQLRYMLLRWKTGLDVSVN